MGEYNQEDDAYKHSDPKRENATEDSVHGNIFGHPADDEHIDPYRRSNQAHFHDQGDNNAKPDRIKSHPYHHWIDDGYGQDHYGQAFHKATQDNVCKDKYPHDDESI